MSRLLLLSALLSSACSGGTATITIMNELTGMPMRNIALTLRAQEEVSFSCQIFEGSTDDTGVAIIPGPCLGSSGYSIAPKDSSLWLLEGAILERESEGVTSIQALRAPSGSGAYRLEDDTLTPLSTHADIKQATIIGSDESVEFPSSIPQETDIPRIGTGSWLVLVGVGTVESARLVPLVRSGPRRLNKGSSTMTMQDWWYMGVRFSSDREFTRQAAMVDDSRSIRHTIGDRAAYIIPSNAVPRGRYALRTAGSNRLTVLDFGPPAE